MRKLIPNRLRRIILLIGAMTVLMILLALAMKKGNAAVECSYNLKRIYQALDLYEMHNGALPVMAFYPDEPFSDPASIRVVLETYGPEESTWTCPAIHPLIRQTGLSYIWNTSLNGASLRNREGRIWMLMELNAMSRDVDRPHFGSCNVLFTDGSVERIRFPDNLLTASGSIPRRL